MTWLRKIENLRKGDACEFRYPARVGWRRGTVIVNGGSSYWTIFDEEKRGPVEGLFIEHVRCVDQTEAWSR